MSQSKQLSVQSYLDYHVNQLRLITAQSILNTHKNVRTSISNKDTIVAIEMYGDAPEYLHAISRRGDGDIEVYDLGFLSDADASLDSALTAITGAVKTRAMLKNYTVVMSIGAATALLDGVSDPNTQLDAVDSMWDMLYQAKSVYLV